MKMLNSLEQAPKGEGQAAPLAEGFSLLLRLLAPITPHICHALWKELGYGGDILTAPWPNPLDAALVQDEIELVLQVNGKTRGNVRVPAEATRAPIEAIGAGLGGDAEIHRGQAGEESRRRSRPPGQHRPLTRPCAILTLLPLLSLGACGFHLRGCLLAAFRQPLRQPAGSERFARHAQAQHRAGTRARVSDDAASAQATLQVVKDTQKDILSIGSDGRVREFQLVRTIHLPRRSTRPGTCWWPPAPSCSRRDVTFSDSAVLSKEAEEGLLWRDIQDDLVQQILRRLAAAKMRADATILPRQ